jgi:hypothetical protein
MMFLVMIREAIAASKRNKSISSERVRYYSWGSEQGKFTYRNFIIKRLYASFFQKSFFYLCGIFYICNVTKIREYEKFITRRANP